MPSIDLDMLSTIPFLDIPNLKGRYISSLTFFANGDWRMWIPVDDQLIEIKAWPAEATYFSAEPQSSDDLNFHFLDFIAQRASYPELKMPIIGLQDDVFNLSASLAKILHFHETRNVIGTGVSRMVVTEVEYLFSICRSMFDLLQEIAYKLWESIQLSDPAVKKKSIKKSFADMVRFEGREATAEELVRRFGLPEPMAAYYMRNAKFFLALRNFRDNLAHRGSQVQTIFPSEAGFLIQHSLMPFSEMDIWREDEKHKNDLVPLLPALGVIVHSTLAACDDFSATIEKICLFPPPIVPNMRFYMRGYFNAVLSSSLRDASSRLSTQS